MLRFEDGVFGSFSDFPVLWGSEIKAFSITHLFQESGKGSEELEAVVGVSAFQLEVDAVLQLPTVGLSSWYLALLRAFVFQLSPPHFPFLEPCNSRVQS